MLHLSSAVYVLAIAASFPVSRVLAGAATADVGAGMQDGKLLANRLKVLLGTSTFLQAFQHSGTLFVLQALHNERSCLLSCSLTVVLCRAIVPGHIRELCCRTSHELVDLLKCTLTRRARAKCGGVPGGHQRAAARAELPDGAARVCVERSVLQFRLPAAV